MIHVLKLWFHRYFSDPQAVLLVILLLVGLTVIFTMGQMLTPMIAAIVIGFLLEGPTGALAQYRRVPRIVAVWFVFIGFLAFLIFTLLVILPLLSIQMKEFIQETPTMMLKGQKLLLQLPQRYPEFISASQVNSIIHAIRDGMNNFAQTAVSYSVASIPALLTFLIYLVLVPVMIFFFLKDKLLILSWLKSILPPKHDITDKLGLEMNKQMGNYVRGKIYEIFIVGSACYVVFTFMGLGYAQLMAVLVGFSVVVPYIGATAVTFPVVLVAYFQWNWGSDFFWLIAVYFLVQILDGNVLVPLLFSEAVNLHPVAIIVAVLVFGGIWGFWGVFFAIPLATLVKALLISWPRAPEE